jgi:hypothetical protein
VRILNKLEKYSDSLQEILIACKIQNINANIKKLQDDILAGVRINNIIDNLYKYI